MAPSPYTPDFDQLVEATLERWHIPGAAFAVVHGAGTWTKGYGYAQRDPRRDTTTTTLFYVASTSKAHLCAAWALYIDSAANKSKPKDQQVGFATPLADIIRDDFVLSDPIRTVSVTLEDALSHRTGLPPHELSYGYEGKKTARDITRNLRHVPFHHELRETFEYCNTPFIAASHALEVLTGKPLSQLLREGLWEPLGMKQTYAGYSEAAAAVESESAVLAKGYTWSKTPFDVNETDGHLAEEAYMDLSDVSGAGYVISTADDYAKWMRFFLEPSSGSLTTVMIKELFTPRSIVPADDHDKALFDGLLTYGLGWYVTTYKGHMLYWHPGGIIGAGSLAVLVPDLNWGASYFAHGQNSSVVLKSLIMELLDQVLGIPEAEKTGRKESEESAVDLYRTMEEAVGNARLRLFPNAPPTPTVALTLPIEAYVGTYRNAAYGPLTVTVSNDSRDEDGNTGHASLQSKLHDRTWFTTFDFVHVNAEAWLVRSFREKSPWVTALKAESRIGVNGEVDAFGIGMEPAMPSHMFWFENET